MTLQSLYKILVVALAFGADSFAGSSAHTNELKGPAMFKKISLTQGKFAIVDNRDYGYLNRFNWSVARDYSTFYAVRGVMYKGKRLNVRMHRVVLGIPEISDLVVDHINGNGLDNRFSNLRKVDFGQNGANRGINKNNTTGFKGVCFRKKRKIYCSVLYKKPNTFYGKDKKTAVEAAKEYDKMAIHHFGKYAKTNKFMGLY